jgi:hypothetical protein
MRRFLALGLALLVLSAGCGGDDGSSSDGAGGGPRTLDVASGGQYSETVLPAVDEVLGIRGDLPEEGELDDDGTRSKVVELMEKVQQSSSKIAGVTAPPEVLSNHQHLTDAVTIVEFDLLDLADPIDAAAARANLDRVKEDLDRLENTFGEVKNDLEKVE